MRKEIKIITTTSKNLWNRFISENLYKQGISTLIVDFSKCYFVEPFHVVLLACLIEDYKKNNETSYEDFSF